MAWILDTHALIWALFEPQKLGRRSRKILENPELEVWVSPISYWEISLKHGLGKLILPDTDPSEIPDAALRLGLKELSIPSSVLATYHQLPRSPEHRDPFDRMLIWQCIVGRHTFLSKDGNLKWYAGFGLKYEW